MCVRSDVGSRPDNPDDCSRANVAKNDLGYLPCFQQCTQPARPSSGSSVVAHGCEVPDILSLSQCVDQSVGQATQTKSAGQQASAADW
jgi:hypothetical protein